MSKKPEHLFERKTNIGPFSNCADIKPQKEGFNDAICEKCERIFKTKKNEYICPNCVEKEDDTKGSD